MSATTCDRCGAQLIAETKFCRRCGTPQASLAGDPKHEARLEAPTRTLDANQSPAAPTDRWQSPPTTPAYLAPQAATPTFGAAHATQALQPKRKKSISLVGLAVLFMLLLASLVAAGIVIDRVFLRRIITETRRRTEAPPVPPAPPAPDQDGKSASTDSSLVYPGAETTLDVNDGDEGEAVRQLRTPDKFDKVVEWYTARLKPTKTVRSPRINEMPFNNSILSNSDTTVVITEQEGGTMIIITRENKK